MTSGLAGKSVLEEAFADMVVDTVMDAPIKAEPIFSAKDEEEKVIPPVDVCWGVLSFGSSPSHITLFHHLCVREFIVETDSVAKTFVRL